MFDPRLLYLLFNVLFLTNGLEYSQNFLRDHILEGKIVGGVSVSLTQFPYNVQIFNMGNMCAGSILNSWTILTAAHCFDLNKNFEEISIHVGSRFTYDFSARVHRVAALHVHERYNLTGLFANDIALLFLTAPIKFDSIAKKAILVNTDRWMQETEADFIVTGWGLTKYTGAVSKTLQKTHLRFISLKKCEKLHQLPFTSEMFCLYGEGERDTCKGDSGGSVQWHGMIVGIISHGFECAAKNSPSVYTNVWRFRKWIKDHVYQFMNEYCKTHKLVKNRNFHDYYDGAYNNFAFNL